tara:strand:+ start:53 stop:1990 length:1938 start_codon:yes stop_codon:yes gene_type:complete
MANKFTKEKIDFDVYERQDPASQVDWGKAAADITKTVAGIRDERIKRKGEIDKAFEDQQTALTDIGKYDNVTLQQLVMNGYQDAANKTTDIQNLVRRGLMKPSEAKLFRHNTMTGMNLLKKNAVQYDVSFKDYEERLASGKGAAGEEWGAGELEGFANINNLQVQTDPVTGNVVQLRVDPKTGEPIPGESLSVQHMTVLLNQRMDAMDMTAEITNVNKAVGDVILAQRKTAGITDILTSQEMTRLSAEYLADNKNKNFLNSKIDLVLQDPFKQQDMLVDHVTTNGKPDGESYYIGKQETHDQWNKDNPGQEELNPVLVMGFGDDSLRKAEFTEAQDKRAREHVKVQLIGAQDYKEDIQTKKIQATEYQDSAATIASGKQDDEADSSGKSVNLLVTGTAVEAEAASKDLISSFENLTDIDRVVDADGKVTAFNIKIEGKVVDPISAFDSKGNAKTPDQLNREIFKLVGAKGTYDAWLKRNKVGENVGEGGSSSSQAAAEISHNLPSDMVVVGDSKITYDSFFNSESGGNLGSTLAERGFSSDGESEVQQGFTNLLESPSFVPKGLKDFISNEGGKISVKVGKSGGAKNNQMVITIGNEVITYDDVYLDESTGGTTGIAQKIREAIEKEVKRANTGGGKKTKKKNVG